ncbi:hypothetical protein ONZ45_g8502 [Pleurotus djamor]|nr:hypothetical protein ONZ45_g8502 [Pleurotus djamor]
MSTSALSTVARGTAFETRSIKVLAEALSMDLRRVGGRGDGGVDIVGWWPLPDFGPSSTLPTRIRVLAQCKAEKQKIGPKYIRELEGVLHEHIRKAETGPMASVYPHIGLFLSESPFSKATILRTLSSSLPFLLLHLPPTDSTRTSSGEIDVIGSAFVNPAFSASDGLLRGDVEVRWEWCPKTGDGRPGVWVRGRKLGGSLQGEG